MSGNWKFGAAAKRLQRLVRSATIKDAAVAEIPVIKDRELFYMGLMLYWAEGFKETDKSIGEGLGFSNSDPQMCRLFIKWLKQCLKIENYRISLRIYLHDSWRGKEDTVLSFWSSQTGVVKTEFKPTCFSKTKQSVDRKREGKSNYNGQLRIRVSKSADLNRKIAGWIQGVCLQSL